VLSPRKTALLGAALALATVALRARAMEPEKREVVSAPTTSAPFDVVADKLWYDGRSGDWILDGHVLVTREAGVLHASRARFLHDANALFLEGPVLAVQGSEVATADGARIDLTSRSAELTLATLYVKSVSTSALRALSDPKAARTLGHNAATLHAARAVKQDDGSTVLGEVTLTPCDCAGRPDYEIDSPEVLIEGDRAYLSRPHIRFLGLRVPFLPLALPLEDRQSGMLAPQMGYASSTGLRFALPVYFTLGRSWDLTVTPGVFGGSFGGDHGADLASRDVRGPRLAAELRWAPVEGTRGELGIDAMKDFAAVNSLAQQAGSQYPGEFASRAGRGFDGFRGTLRFADRSDLFGWTLVAQGQLASDAMVVADTQPLQIDRYLDDLRSDLGLFRSFGPLVLGFDATYLQDLRVLGYTDASGIHTSVDRRLFGAEARATPTRLPSPFLQLLPQLLGPLVFSTEASLVSVATFSPSAEEKAIGFGPSDLGAGEPAAQINSASGVDLARTPTVRFDLAPKLSASLPDELPVRGKLVVGARADAWRMADHAERNAQRLQGLAGAEASVLLERNFGAFRHTIEPQVFTRALTPALLGGATPLGDLADAGGPVYATNPLAAQQGVAPGGLPPCPTGGPCPAMHGVPALRRALDELDGSAPSTGEVESSFAIRQSLWGKPNPRGPPVRIASLVLQQDVVLWDHAGPVRAADSSALATLSLPFLSFSGEARWDWHLRLFSLALASLSLRDARTDDLHFGATVLRGAAGDHIRAGVDELFAATLLMADPGDFNGTLSAGISWALPIWALPIDTKGSRLGYDLSYHPGTLLAGVPDLVHTASFSWSPPCGCAALSLGVDLPFRDGKLLYAPSVRFNFQFQGLGR
jgi:LPS-assembly protein